MENPTLIPVNANTYVAPHVSGRSEGFVVEFSTRSINTGKPRRKKIPGVESLVTWGANNLAPLEILSLVQDNNLNPGILRRKRDFIIGRELVTSRRMITDGKKQTQLQEFQEWDAFVSECDIEEEIHQAAFDLVIFGNAFVELSFDHDGRVKSAKHIDATTVRLGIGNTTAYICADWSDRPTTDAAANGQTIYTRKLYDANALYSHELVVVHLKDYFPAHPYYSPPDWIGARFYIELANRIPEFHAMVLKNGYNIKYHIEIPAAYIASFPEDKRDAAKAEVARQIDKLLSGAENAGKSLISYYGNDYDGKPSHWLIKAIDNPLKDDAYSVLFDKTNIAIISAHGIPSSLANIDDGSGGLGSGSEVRVATQFYIAIATPRPRKILLKIPYIIKTRNGFDPAMQFSFIDTELTTIDKNPTGTQSSIM